MTFSDEGLTKMSADDIRNELIRLGKRADYVFSLKGKSALKEAYKSAVENTNPPQPDVKEDLNTETFLQFSQPTESENVEDFEKKPVRTDLEWEDYVLSLLDDSEKRDGHPRVHGLRRIAEKLLGEIIFSGPINNFTDYSDLPGKSWVLYEVQFLTPVGVKTFRELGNCTEASQPNRTFNVFPEAIAATRSEGRTLRKALNLKGVAFEELIELPEQPQQTRILHSVAEMLKTKALQMKLEPQDLDLSSFEELFSLTNIQGQHLLAKLNTIQQK